jgi:hypothetical protein
LKKGKKQNKKFNPFGINPFGGLKPISSQIGSQFKAKENTS